MSLQEKKYKKPITSQIRSKPGKVKKSPTYKSQLQKATTTMPSLPVYPKQISTEKPKISRHTLPSKFYQRKQQTKVPPAQYKQRFYDSPKTNSPRQKRCIDCEKCNFTAIIAGFKGSQRIPKDSKGFQRIPKDSKEFQWIPKYSKGFQRIPKLPKVFQRIPKDSKVFPSILKNYKGL